MMQKTNLKRSVLHFTAAAALLLVASIGNAQSKYTESADREFERGGYSDASKEYLIAYNKLKGIEEKGRVSFQIAECHRLMLDLQGAADYYNKAIGFKYFKENPEVFFNYAETLREQNKFDEAVKQYNEYKDKGGDKSKANTRIKECEEAALALDQPPTRYVVEQVPVLNTEQFDYAPAWASKKGDEMILSSSRAASTGTAEDPITGESFMDLFVSERDKKGKWSTPILINNTVNTTSSEGVVAFDKKFQTMYFTRCVYEGKSNFACDIFKAKRQGKNFGPAEPLNIINRDEDDSSLVGHPCITPDDKYMIFSSDMPGGFGGKDLWYMEYDSKADKWSKPKNLGNTVNTKGDEGWPHVKADGTLYFSSTGHPGLGGYDMFSASPSGDMVFGNVQNLKYPLNSSSDDLGIIFEETADQGFFSSNRPGGKGKDDIYSFKMPPLEFCYRATVYDDKTGTPLANSNIVIAGTDGSSFALKTDGNGGVSLCEGEVLKDVSYNVDVALDGYIGTGDKYSTVGLTESTTFAREYFLKPIIIGEKYDMPLVLYPFNQATLLINEQVNSADSLNYLYDLMVKNPTFVVQLESHTDTRGSVTDNQKLSQRRAQTCVDYLVGRGIDTARLVASGKGESEPLISDKMINAMATEEEKEIAHQKNRRTVFTILRYDYVPKQ
ncbi:MAG: OmpA family protein [Cryomorphaceae bacterium]|nr:OmpA family protein [Cryomorphaceae bacterium]